jgi:hypothetical protein
MLFLLGVFNGQTNSLTINSSKVGEIASETPPNVINPSSKNTETTVVSNPVTSVPITPTTTAAQATPPSTTASTKPETITPINENSKVSSTVPNIGVTSPSAIQ